MKMTQSQEIVKAFCEALRLRFTGTLYTRQIGQASALLKTYTFEEIMSVIDYLGRKGYKKPISSIAFLQYIMNETLQSIEADSIKKKLAEQEVTFTPTVEEVKPLNQAKIKENKFVKRGMVSF